ncbi:DNA helicase [Actinorhabdospora filicis]|uniref:DNA helicase n=1 Tax=Actinorhabdospora filicis TaxID=1785913 RepID=A0A9W6SK60_9ACTN|nr:AAA family ATPase [Actinorhabdospora filicis]GLZ76106.1 DNA helicase [Actinorhabdospora filicis]
MSQNGHPGGTDTAARDAEIAQEQEHVDTVYGRLDELRAVAVRAEKDGYNFSHARVPGAQYERDVFVYQAAKRLHTLDAEHEGLVFGRLDLDGDITRHIGRIGLRDAAQKPLLLDWRAPAAAPFYRATAADRMSVIRRRVIRSSGRTVLDISDDLLDTEHGEGELSVIGDGALMAALARARGERMKDIVATIQREQDEAIRAEARGVTMISGGPGTGKTVVALHRAAYLLYADRRRFEGGGVLVVGPSTVFLRYIERVLPSLGEDAAALYALGEFVDGAKAVRQDAPAVAAVKGAMRIRKVLSRAARLTPPTAPETLTIVYRGQVLRLGEPELTAARRAVHARNLQHNHAVTEAGRALLIALWRKAKERIESGLVPAEFSREVGHRNEFLDFLHRWWPELGPETVLRWLGDPRLLGQASQGALTRREVERVAASLTETDWSVSDIPLLDELAGLLGRPKAPKAARENLGDGIQELTTVQDRLFTRAARSERGADYDGYAHVVVDEAQDLSPMQWRMLGRRGRQASWTIVGDAAQSSWPDAGEARRARNEALGRLPRREFHLTTNYRNSAEIFEYAAESIRESVPDADIPKAVRRTGAVPVELRVPHGELPATVAERVKELLGQVEGTVGVITPATERDQVAGWLEPDERVHVMTALESKGLEFDAVVAVRPDRVAAESGPGVRYVVFTRATQFLTVVNSL